MIARAADLPEPIRDITPLEGLLLCMRWSILHGDRDGILAAASAAAPYCHARLASSDVRIRDEHADLSDEELKAEIIESERRYAAAETLH